MSLISRALGSLPDAAWPAVHDAAHGLRMLLKTRGFTP
jgi:hypothetical protein